MTKYPKIRAFRIFMTPILFVVFGIYIVKWAFEFSDSCVEIDKFDYSYLKGMVNVPLVKEDIREAFDDNLVNRGEYRKIMEKIKNQKAIEEKEALRRHVKEIKDLTLPKAEQQ